VAQQTAKRITNLIPPGGVASDTRLVLVNAIYFLGDWLSPFQPNATAPAPFHLGPTSTVDVPTMHQNARLKAAKIDGAQLVELPYRDGTLAMTIVVPEALDGLGALEQSLSMARLERWSSALVPAQVDLALPRFAIDPSEPLSLGGALGAMGVHRAFDSTQADFTAIANPPDPELRLFFSAVFHKAFVQVDEKGTEAAAATAIVATAGCAAPPEAVSVQVDRPFLFFIRDLDTGMVVFMGRVSNPATSG
jgi:serpin B